MRKKTKAFSLVELIIFIGLVAISVSVLIPLLLALRHTQRFSTQTQALELAQQRMELVIAERNSQGFGFSDPCDLTNYSATCPTPPPGGDCICNTINGNGDSYSPSGFIVTSSITNNGSNYKTVKVTVTNKGTAYLTTELANY